MQFLHFPLQVEDVSFQLLHSIEASNDTLCELIVEIFVLSFQRGDLALLLFHSICCLAEGVGIALPFNFNNLRGDVVLQTFLLKLEAQDVIFN